MAFRKLSATRLIILSILLVFEWGSVLAQPAGYYDEAGGVAGEDLQHALHEIIDDHTVLSYAALWTAFQTTDKKSDGTVWDMYSDTPGGTPPYTYTFVSDQCGNYSGEGSCYNREHSFPKSWFNDGSPMYTDLFHLYPTDGYVNGKRGNYPFGETDSPVWTSRNGSGVGPSSWSGYTGTVFEPIDAYKGDFARSYFYMAVRYYGEDGGWTGSPMVDGSQLVSWAKEMLINWHKDDPVSDKEIHRNDAVYALQGNRNPFIDHPEYVELMYSENIDGKTPDIDSILVLSAETLQLQFNEPLDSLSAVSVSHYQISGDVAVLNATLIDEEHSVVLLEVSGFREGTYALTVNGVADLAGNILQMAIYPFEVVGISGLALTSSFEWLSIYPNPTDGCFFLEAKGASNQFTGAELTDLKGRSMSFSYSNQADRIEICSDVPAGTYLLRVAHPNGIYQAFPLLIIE
jgi:endonuclease I